MLLFNPNSRELEDVVVGKRVLWKFNQKNSHILPLLLDYISTFWSFVYFRNSATVSTHARRSDVESTREQQRNYFSHFSEIPAAEKKCFSSSIFEGEFEFMWNFFPVWDFFPSRLLHIARKIDWVASELQISDHRPTARNHLKINYRTFFTPPHRSSVVMCRCRQQNIVRL